jgi:ribosomal protein L37AE/L43A
MESESEETKVEEKSNKPECPVCGSENLMIVSHCITCSSCGWGTCSL